MANNYLLIFVSILILFSFEINQSTAYILNNREYQIELPTIKHAFQVFYLIQSLSSEINLSFFLFQPGRKIDLLRRQWFKREYETMNKANRGMRCFFNTITCFI